MKSIKTGLVSWRQTQITSKRLNFPCWNEGRDFFTLLFLWAFSLEVAKHFLPQKGDKSFWKLGKPPSRVGAMSLKCKYQDDCALSQLLQQQDHSLTAGLRLAKALSAIKTLRNLFFCLWIKPVSSFRFRPPSPITRWSLGELCDNGATRSSYWLSSVLRTCTEWVLFVVRRWGVSCHTLSVNRPHCALHLIILCQ